jgi:3-oxoacyl-[acyl-carrier protein] reductase
VWAKGLSRAIAAKGVTINSIAPGRLFSEQVTERLFPTDAVRQDFIDRHIPIGYFGRPADLASLVAFLASPLARYITGTIIPVDGGMKYAL